MGLKRYNKFLLICIFFANCSIVEAAWQGAELVLSGGWGIQPNQFGIEYGDSWDTFPKGIIVLANGDIWIPDGWANDRLKLYDSSGTLKKLIEFDETTLKFSEYWFIGKYDSTGSDGSVYMSHYMGKNMYAQYSTTGNLLQTYTERPLELGHLKSSRFNSNQYKSTITYPDAVYSIVAKHPLRNYTRDINKYLYNVTSFTAHSGDAITTAYKTYKYDHCGKMLGVFQTPISQYEPPTADDLEAPTWNPVPIAEYGEPVIGPNGNVYTWVRSKTDYKIVKWTWVDEPTDPKGGPDAPVNLNALPSISGIYLSWGISPSDPGCVTGYEVERATSSNGIFTTVSTVAAGVLNFNDTTAAQGSTYFYKIRAVAGGMASDYTGVVSGTRP